MKYTEIINNRFTEPAAIISCKKDEVRLLEINEKYLPELWMNIAKEDYIRAFPQKIFDEDNMDRFMSALKKCAETGQEQEVETWHIVFSNCCGADRLCLRSRFILIEKDGEESFIYEGVRNISNERRTQATLEDIEYRYKQASEQINIYNWEYTIATKEMRPCYRCMRDLGLPALVTNYPEPAIDMGIFPPDYADMYREMMRKIDAGAPQLEADIPLTVSRVPFRVKYTTEFDEDGKPVKAFGSATLISETELGHIKLDNQIIATLAEEYRGIYLIDFVKDTVGTVKQDDILPFDKDATPDSVIASISEKLRETLKDSGIRTDDKEALRTELFKDSDAREFVYKDEENNRWVKIGCHVIERDEAKVNRLLITASIVDDLRAQKMDDDRLIAQQKEELEDRQKMLLSAIDEANRANQAKTEFFSNMSHDIRTPMNAITGFSRLAIDEIDNRENVKDYLDKIITSSDHLLNLINDILDMSRIESGKMELSPSPVRIRDLLLECADMMRIKMEEKKIGFIVSVDGLGEDTVECDRLRFNQVILNLLSNAYKFTPEGGSVFLEGKLSERSEMLTYEIRVRDTGIGMSEEFREHIWEAYTRENTEIVHETQGTGLGMLIVQKTVNLMQGTIELKSEQGKGSEFIIVLPFKPAKEEAGETAVENSVEEALNRSYEGVTVLVVDDTRVNLKLAEHILKKTGFTVKTSDNGVDAIEQIKASKPGEIDLVLMDVMMPVMDGLEATQRIRALPDPELSKIPIIAMTANAFESDIKTALDAGMNGHIPKPFKKEELLVKINEQLKEE